MGDNVYSLLRQVWASATSNAGRILGAEIGIVTNVKDPDKLGRVKVCFPRLPGLPESDWARVGQPAAGPGRGFYWLPHVSDEVLVMFERGQASAPYVIGSLWNGKDKPMKDGYTDENSTIMIQTKSGHQLVIDDKKDQEKITLGDKSGKRTLTWDVKNKKFLIEAKEGDVEIHAEKKLVLQCEDLEIKSSKSTKYEVGTTFELKIAQQGAIKAGPQLNLKGGKVQLNPPDLSIEALVTAAEQAAQAAAEQAARTPEHGEGEKAQAGPDEPDVSREIPPEPSLENPRWGQSRYQHGDQAEMKVDGRHLEGRLVVFTVEHETCSGRWEYWDTVRAPVESGVATATFAMTHPMAEHYAESQATPCPRAVHGDRNFRFRARAAGVREEREPPPPEQSPTDDMLENPRWGSDEHAHEEQAEMIVEAHGWDGRQIWFTVEHDRGGGNWEPFGEPVTATVTHCRAVATFRLRHPLQAHFDDQGATPHPEPDATSGPRQLRFKTSFTRPTTQRRPPRTAYFLSRRLLAHGGTPFANQPVRIIDPDTGARVGGVVRTDSAGNLFVRVPENKPYHLSIVDPHQHDHARPGPNTSGPLDYPMLTVRLVDAAGAPLANEQWRATGPGGATLSGTTDAQGDISCGPAVFGVYELTVRGHTCKVHTVRESRIDPSLPNRLVIR